VGFELRTNDGLREVKGKLELKSKSFEKKVARTFDVESFVGLSHNLLELIASRVT
jgi:hypothetical protein